MLLNGTQVVLDALSVLGVNVDVLTVDVICRLSGQQQTWVTSLKVTEYTWLFDPVRGRNHRTAGHSSVSVVFEVICQQDGWLLGLVPHDNTVCVLFVSRHPLVLHIWRLDWDRNFDGRSKNVRTCTLLLGVGVLSALKLKGCCWPWLHQDCIVGLAWKENVFAFCSVSCSVAAALCLSYCTYSCHNWPIILFNLVCHWHLLQWSCL